MKDLAGSWLAMHCKLTPGVSRGVVCLGEPDRGPFAVAARWPEDEPESSELAAATQIAMADRCGVVRAPRAGEVDSGGLDAVALPLLIEGKLWGAVACEVPHRGKAQQEVVVERMLVDCAWLELLLQGLPSEKEGPASTVLELVALSLEHDRFQGAATALATELAARLGLERVGIGFLRGDRVELRALSHSAHFGKKAAFVGRIERAMDEAVDQQATLAQPALEGAPPSTTRAQKELRDHHDSAAVCSIPFAVEGRIVGAITGERAETTFDRDTVELCEQVAALAGPILDVRRREDRWLGAKIAASLGRAATDAFGPEHGVFKLGVAVTITATLLLAVLPGDYRVSADATLEGTMRRVVVAPMEGFLLEEHARAGDVVHQGQVLAALDDRDLRLERLRWAGQRGQAVTEHREAQAHGDWAQVSILSARLAQADAQLALLDEQLARTRLVAPFDGIIVEGDLSQSLGSPVERGEAFFEVAPLDSYRIILEVDERDIGEVRLGQTGSLALSSMPRQTMALRVERITPIATASEGRNHFRVEASLDEPSELLRPGMEGVAKIGIDRRSRLWILTHRLVDWMRLQLWTWWP